LGVIVYRLKLKMIKRILEWLMGIRPVNELKLSKNDLRSKQTRELLLNAAEVVFVRDGYLGAELGEIAAMAGRSKGAIYGHFKSKEDLYVALLEERISRYRRRVEAVLVGCKSQEEIRESLHKSASRVILE
jgi:AcrR family transcriptional regulator